MADHGETLHLLDADLVPVLPAGSILSGVITSEEAQNLLLQGAFTGRMVLKQNSRVVIAEGAEIEAEHLEAHTIVVRGTVNGHIHAQVLELGPTARVKGSIRYDVAFASQPGARIRGGIEGPQEADE